MKTTEKVKRLAQVFWHYKTQSTVLPYLPIRLWIETTNQCNLRCSVCPNSTDTVSRKGNMDLELYECILDQLKGKANDINLSHRGEPLYHPDLSRMIKMAGDRNLATRIHTNATMMDADKSRELLEAQPDLVSFSFDGYDKESYEAVRIGGIFEETLANIRTFLSEKQKAKLKKPYTVIQIIEPPDASASYLDKLHEFGRNIRKDGLDKFYVKKPHNWAGNTESVSSLAQSYLLCTFLYYSMTVLWNGLVCPCPQDWYGTMVLGDLNDQSVEEVWNGEPLRNLRRRGAMCDLEGLICENCDRVFRDAFLGVPTENVKAFFGETLAGYDLIRTIIKK